MRLITRKIKTNKIEEKIDELTTTKIVNELSNGTVAKNSTPKMSNIIKGVDKQMVNLLEEYDNKGILITDPLSPDEIKKLDILPYEEALELKRKEKQLFEQKIRAITRRGNFLLDKVMDLASGVNIKEKTKDGEKIYTRAPDLGALQLLINYGFGKPLGEEKASIDNNNQNNTQVNIFLPENDRGDGPKPTVEINKQITSKDVIDSEFEYEY